MPSLNIHRNDTVKVLTGADRGKTGRVLRVFPDKGTVLVEHVRVVKKTVSSKQGQRTKGGIAEQESPINVSNVALVCPNCGPARVGYEDRRRHQGSRLQEVRADAADQEVAECPSTEPSGRAHSQDRPTPSATVNGRRASHSGRRKKESKATWRQG